MALFMYKKLLLTTVTATMFLMPAPTIQAGTCVAESSCAPQPIQFKPGDWVSVEVVNLTAGVVQIQQMYTTDPLAVSPGEVFHFVHSANTEPNFSLVFWDSLGLPIKLSLRQPETKKLRIELRPGGSLGDRTLYLRNDGRVEVF
jgi:hypothetical protein